MRVLVAMKRVVDFNVRVRLKADGSGVDAANLKMSTNPFDEIALEEAVRMKEAGRVTEIVAVTVGPPQSQETLRTAFALGADRGVHVTCDGDVQPLAVAKVLRAICEREKPSLVLLGKQAIDDDCNQTGQMLAALLRWPQGTCASKVQHEDGHVLVTREIDGGLQTVRLRLPAVVTSDLRLNEPRHASFQSIVKSKRMAIEQLSAAQLGIDVASRLRTLKVEEPPVRKGGRKVASVQELVDKLKNEAQVL